MKFSLANDKTWSGFLLAISLLMASLLAVLLFVPRPRQTVTIGERTSAEAAVRSQTYAARQLAETATARAATYLWTEGADAVSPKALEIVTQAAKAENLRISAFRPQKPSDADGLEQLAYLVAVEGRFPAVTGFLRRVETPDNRLAVTLFQVTSADGASDAVTATVGLVAFRQTAAGRTKR